MYEYVSFSAKCSEIREMEFAKEVKGVGGTDESLPHDRSVSCHLLLNEISTSTDLGRKVLEKIEIDGYIVLPSVLTPEECDGKFQGSGTL